MRDVALAGRVTNTESNDREQDAVHDSRGVSPVSSLEDDDDRVSAIAPPRAIADPAERKSHSPSRDSRFREMIN